MGSLLTLRLQTTILLITLRIQLIVLIRLRIQLIVMIVFQVVTLLRVWRWPELAGTAGTDDNTLYSQSSVSGLGQKTNWSCNTQITTLFVYPVTPHTSTPPAPRCRLERVIRAIPVRRMS